MHTEDGVAGQLRRTALAALGWSQPVSWGAHDFRRLSDSRSAVMPAPLLCRLGKLPVKLFWSSSSTDKFIHSLGRVPVTHPY